MNPILLVIVDVITDQAAKVFLVQRDDVIEDLVAATPDPSLRDSARPQPRVLPGNHKPSDTCRFAGGAGPFGFSSRAGSL